MTSAKEMARIFQAAADGVMEPYSSNIHEYGGVSYSARYDLAKSIAGAMRAIAAVYRTIAETEDSAGG